MTTTKARVLVVDDEPLIRMILADVLADSCYEVFEAGDGTAAIALLDKIDSVDLVVTDVNTPLCSGFDVANYARLRHPGLPVVFVTGLPNQIGFHEMPEPWMLLAKPFSLMALLATVGDMLGSGA